MDDDYFARFSAEELSTHVRMSSKLDSMHPVQFRFTAPSSAYAGEFDIIIVGSDYLSWFSTLSGLLSAFGLHIRTADVYSFTRLAGQPVKNKTVGVFRVNIAWAEAFDEVAQDEFGRELEAFARLLAARAVEEARERLNRLLLEQMERMNQIPAGLLSAVEIIFDDDISPDWTVMNVHSEDDLALHYAFSNALALRNIYIHRIDIRSFGGEVTDRFFIANSSGRKITENRERERLRVAVNLNTQFTRFLPKAPDPAKAMRHFNQFLDRAAEMGFPDHVIWLLNRNEGMSLLAHLFGSSDFLWDDFLSTHFRDLLPVLKDFTGPSNKAFFRRELCAGLDQASSLEEKKQILNQFKDEQLFRIDAKRLLDPNVTVTDFAQALTALAEVLVNESAKICYQHLARQHGEHGPFAIFGLGKFGGSEIGYASDLELLFVHEAEESTPFFELLVRRVTGLIETSANGTFHIDLRLRPYGDAGPLSTRFDQFVNYYGMNGQAAPFERQALTKLRWFAGDEALGRRVEAHRDGFCYSSAPWDWENALHLRRRRMREFVRPRQINVKYSAGGIIDIELAVQYLQLQHGKDYPELRVTNTIQALNQLRGQGLIEEAEHRALHAAYFFLRNLIDSLRVVRGDARDLELPSATSEEFKSLARRLGYAQQDRAHAAIALATDVRQCMKTVHEYFLRRFEPPQKSGERAAG